MFKSYYLSKFLYVAVIFFCVDTYRPDISRPPEQKNAAEKTKRERLQEIYATELGVRELSGKNDGPKVEQYLHYVGLKKGNPWCAAFVCWALGNAGLSNPRSGWSPDLFPDANVTWRRSRALHADNKPPRPGDVFGIWFPQKGRIAHVGFVDHWGENWMISVEGNTNEAGSAEGDGVYRKRRLIASIYKVSDFIKEKKI